MFPLAVQPMEGVVVCKTTIFLFHIKRFPVRTPVDVNSLYSLRYLIIDYCIQLNKLEFDAPEIQEVAIKVQIICLDGETTCQCTANALICTLNTPNKKIIEYLIYNMYSRNFAGPIFNRLVKNPEEEKVLPLRCPKWKAQSCANRQFFCFI